MKLSQKLPLICQDTGRCPCQSDQHVSVEINRVFT
jgi:hypothetical protein